MNDTHSYMDEPWSAYRIFLAAARRGSFTAAAKALGLGQATVSRQIAQLEDALGYALFDRGPDGLLLTAAGETILPRAETMEHAAMDIGAALQGLEATPEGTVRLAVPPSLGVDLIRPFAKRLYPCYPKLQIELLSSTGIADLSRGEADLAIRIPRPTEHSLIVRKIREFPLGLWASASYLRSLPKNPTLSSLTWVGWVGDYSHLPVFQWIRQHVGEVHTSFRSNNFAAQREAARAGLGVIMMPNIQAAITPGMLPVPVATPELPAAVLHLVLHRPLRQVPRVRVVADCILEILQMEPEAFAKLHSDD